MKLMSPHAGRHGVIRLAVVVLVMALMLRQTIWRGEIVFEAQAVGAKDGRIQLLCRNETLYPITFFAPWTEGLGENNPKQTYGADIYVKSADEDTFQRFSSEGALWLRQGQPNIFNEPSGIAPGLIEEFFFDLSELVNRLPGLRAVRLMCSRADGKILFEFTLELPLEISE
ncbi:MAG: hypothetical protein IH629_03310 [Thermoleophilia bacterium]|nr:hypothetical protein [Thermoleophilia bacterium]